MVYQSGFELTSLAITNVMSACETRLLFNKMENSCIIKYFNMFHHICNSRLAILFLNNSFMFCFHAFLKISIFNSESLF